MAHTLPLPYPKCSARKVVLDADRAVHQAEVPKSYKMCITCQGGTPEDRAE